MLLLFLAMTLVRLLLLGVPDSVLTIHMICSSDVTLVTGNVCFLLHVKLVTTSTVIGKPFEFLTQCVFAKAVVSCKLCFQTLYVVYFVFPVPYGPHKLFVLCNRKRIRLSSFFCCFS